MRNFAFLTLAFTILSSLLHAQIFVAPDGDDANLGTKEQPIGTIPKAIAEITPGDTIYVRGGTYEIANTIFITAAKTGTEDQFLVLTAYQDEVPVLDFSGQRLGDKGISLRSNFWHIRGLHIKGAGDNGMEINFGSNNLIERCSFYENRDTGLQLSNGSAYNRIINCDSYFNADPPDYGDADGFAPKLAVGTGNYFYGCRAWGNSDDGWDGYLRGADDVTTILENCWTWGNGYLKDGSDPGPQANGNGFKMGGGDNSNRDRLMHHATLIRCVAFGNKSKGFDQNNNLGSMTLINCTGFDNQVANYRIQRVLNPGQTLTIKNSVSFQGAVQLGSFAAQEANSWLPPFVVTADDFLSLDMAQAAAPRKPDGSLPDIDFLHLAPGSDLIDAGVDLGYPFNGLAPDLGAFESDYVTSVSDISLPGDFRLLPNYPNPFNPSTTIAYELPRLAWVKIKVYDMLGRAVAELVNSPQEAGFHTMVWQAEQLPSGVYYLRLTAGNFSAAQKLMLVR